MDIWLLAIVVLLALNLIASIWLGLRLGKPGEVYTENLRATSETLLTALRTEHQQAATAMREEHARAAAAMREEFRLAREEQQKSARELREEQDKRADSLRSELSARFTKNEETTEAAFQRFRAMQKEELGGVQKRLDTFTEQSQRGAEQLRTKVAEQLKELQEGNERKLEAMRKTVEEQLQGTLQKRLGESFKLVSERLEAVQRGLGEMQNLATGVGDLKRVLTNVKTRGTWGEVQLGAVLEQILTPEQYDRNVATREGSAAIVEYAIRLPGRDDGDRPVWLPIDAKFPQEDYQRLLEASETGDRDQTEAALTALARAFKKSAQDISEKYVDPPRTTDFALMFLPTEGLYAEVLRVPGLVDELQQRYRVIPAGPTTLAAILNSLRLGFRTLAIEKRASEVWQILGAVKTEFGKFGEVLDRVKKQLTTASNTIDQAGVRTRAMERKLRDVEQLPDADKDKAEEMLGLE